MIFHLRHYGSVVGCTAVHWLGMSAGVDADSKHTLPRWCVDHRRSSLNTLCLVQMQKDHVYNIFNCGFCNELLWLAQVLAAGLGLSQAK